jgi:hypothetical protein
MRAQIGDHLEHRCPGERRTAARILPAESGGVHGDEIPDVFIHVEQDLRAGFLAKSLRSAHLSREPMALIPKLGSAAVRNSGQRAGADSDRIGHQNRLPHDEDRERRGFEVFQHCLECGGPPQTGASCGREQAYHAHFGGGVIEQLLEGRKAGAVQIDQRQLTGGRARGREPEISAGQAEQRQQSQQKNETLRSQDQL